MAQCDVLAKQSKFQFSFSISHFGESIIVIVIQHWLFRYFSRFLTFRFRFSFCINLVMNGCVRVRCLDGGILFVDYPAAHINWTYWKWRVNKEKHRFDKQNTYPALSKQMFFQDFIAHSLLFSFPFPFLISFAWFKLRVYWTLSQNLHKHGF